MRLASLAVFITLAACGGGGGLVEDDRVATQTPTERILAFRKDIRRSIDLPGTAFVAMPTAGTADFDGSTFIAIDPDPLLQGDEIVLIGATRVTADFGAGSLSGRIDRLSGRRGADLRSGRDVAVDGAVALREGRIGGTVPNDATARYRGSVTVEDETYSLRGRLSGKFRGTVAARSGTPDAPKQLTLAGSGRTVTDSQGQRIGGILLVTVDN